jgi:1,6-anhydro-N-acetylmuramate kinase
MNGTSLDGVDVALIEIDGERIAGLGHIRLPITFPQTTGAPMPLAGRAVAQP